MEHLQKVQNIQNIQNILNQYFHNGLAKIMQSFLYGNIIYQNTNVRTPDLDKITVDISTSSKYSGHPTIDSISIAIHNLGMLNITTTGKICHMEQCDDIKCIYCAVSSNGSVITIHNLWNDVTADTIVFIIETVRSAKKYCCEIIGLREIYHIDITSNVTYNGHGSGMVEWYRDRRLFNIHKLV